MLILALEKTRPPEEGRVVHGQIPGLGPGVPEQAGVAPEWEQHHPGRHRTAPRGHWFRELDS